MIEFLTKKCRLWKAGKGAHDVTISFMVKVSYTGLELIVEASFAKMHYERPGVTLSVGTDARTMRSKIRKALGGWMLDGLEGSFVQEYEAGIARMRRRHALAPHVMMLTSSLMSTRRQGDTMPSDFHHPPFLLMLEPGDVVGMVRHGYGTGLSEVLEGRVECIGS